MPLVPRFGISHIPVSGRLLSEMTFIESGPCAGPFIAIYYGFSLLDEAAGNSVRWVPGVHGEPVASEPPSNELQSDGVGSP